MSIGLSSVEKSGATLLLGMTKRKEKEEDVDVDVDVAVEEKEGPLPFSPFLIVLFTVLVFLGLKALLIAGLGLPIDAPDVAHLPHVTADEMVLAARLDSHKAQLRWMHHHYFQERVLAPRAAGNAGAATGIGLFCTAQEEDEVTEAKECLHWRLPAAVVITPRAIASTRVGRALDTYWKQRAMAAADGIVDGRLMTTALFLLYQRRGFDPDLAPGAPAAGAASLRWTQLVSPMPDTFSTVEYWSGEELRELQGSAREDALAAMERFELLVEEVHHYVDKEGGNEFFRFDSADELREGVKWALACVSTRAQLLEATNDYLVAPLLDLVNHEAGARKMRVAVNETDGSVLVFGGSVQRDGQIVTDYGGETSTEFLLRFGFVPLQLTFDRVFMHIAVRSTQARLMVLLDDPELEPMVVRRDLDVEDPEVVYLELEYAVTGELPTVFIHALTLAVDVTDQEAAKMLADAVARQLGNKDLYPTQLSADLKLLESHADLAQRHRDALLARVSEKSILFSTLHELRTVIKEEDL